MPSRHRHRQSPPFAVPLGGSLIAVLVVAVVAASTGGGGVEGPPEGAGGPSPIPSGVRAAASGGPEGAATDDERRGALVIHGAGDVSLDPGYIPAFTPEGRFTARLLPAHIVSDGHPVLR